MSDPEYLCIGRGLKRDFKKINQTEKIGLKIAFLSIIASTQWVLGSPERSLRARRAWQSHRFLV